MSGQATSPISRRLSRPGEPLGGVRLSLVPRRSLPAARTPFVALMVTLLAVGVVGLLMVNTQMQQRSFGVTQLQARASALQAQVQRLRIGQQELQDPQHLAILARRLGMVVPANPTFITLGTGRVVGVPLMSSTGDAMQIRQRATPKPAHLAPPPRIVHVTSKTPVDGTVSTQVGTSAKKSSGSGGASTGARSGQGRNGSTGVHR